MDIFSWFLRRNVKKTRWYPLSGIPWYVPYPLQSRAALLHTFFRHSGTLYFCSSPQTEITQGRFFPNIFCPHTTCTLYRRIFSLRILVLPQKNRSPHAMCHFPKHISYNPSPCYLNIVYRRLRNSSYSSFNCSKSTKFSKTRSRYVSLVTVLRSQSRLTSYLPSKYRPLPSVFSSFC